MNEDKDVLAAKILGFMKQHDPIGIRTARLY